jgi:hypothetical protein
MFRPTLIISFALLASPIGLAYAEDRPSLVIVWPQPDSSIDLGNDPEKAIGIVVKSSFTLLPAGQCGHVHLKIDPNGDTCNIPGKPFNSMNSDFGGDLIKARFGHCPNAAGKHVIGVLLADDHHKPILVDSKPVTALVTVITK